MSQRTADAERVEQLARHSRIVSEFAKNEDAAALERIFGNVRRLGLEKNIAELDAWGYTTVSPGKLAPPGFTERVLKKVFEVSEARSGVKPDLHHDTSHAHLPFRGETLRYLLADDPLFEQVLLNEVQLALASYLVGEHCVLSAMSASIKGPNNDSLALHTDTHTPRRRILRTPRL